ncbi:MAG TPA: ABC transporter permease [Burkholderiaceae bacterium]
MDDSLTLIFSLLASTLRLSTPLVLAALAGMLAERSGVVDIGLEGKMLAAAFAAAAVASVYGSPWLGLGAGIFVAFVLSILHGVASITYNGNQMVSGMAINIVAAGTTVTLATAWFQQGGQTPMLLPGTRFGDIAFPFVEQLAGVPVLGPFYAKVVSGNTVLVYLMLVLVPVLSWALFKSRFGLRLRAVGENPHAVDTAGISVARLRYLAMAWNGVLCGIAGAYLSTAQGNTFLPDMTAGKGFLAIAAVIFGKWKPWPTFFACLLFAFTDALQVRLQGVSVPGLGEIPVQFIQMIPYVLTVLVLAGFVGRALAPKAIGVPYVKSR